MSDLVDQIDALLELNAKGAVSHPIPGLAVELLERARAAISPQEPVTGEGFQGSMLPSGFRAALSAHGEK